MKKHKESESSFFSFKRWARLFRQPLFKKRATLLLILLTLLASLFPPLFTTQSFYCGSCHIMKPNYLSWEKSNHAQIGCLQCHQTRGFLSSLFTTTKIARYFLFTFLKIQPQTLTAQVPSENCLECHPAIVEKPRETGGIRVSHREFNQSGYPCTTCHSQAAHLNEGKVRNAPTMDRCFDCHNDVAAPSRCSLCHLEPVRNRKIKPALGSAWALIHTGSTTETHGLGSLKTCSICHQKTFCQKCHQVEMPHEADWSYFHSKKALANRESCFQCHQKKYCQNCHQLEMPHPTSFLIKHGEISEKDEELCRRCHPLETCNFCHVESVHHYVGDRFRVIE
jgi:hypothetical protein